MSHLSEWKDNNSIKIYFFIFIIRHNDGSSIMKGLTMCYSSAIVNCLLLFLLMRYCYDWANCNHIRSTFIMLTS